ncbi:MAG: hypothetical protein MI753_02945 [Hyphomicrobiales bacterium]|nr:hypothetical protein [Hyphomicrobiales bacterium]
MPLTTVAHPRTHCQQHLFVLRMGGCLLAGGQCQNAGEIAFKPQIGFVVPAAPHNNATNERANIFARLKPRLFVLERSEQPVDSLAILFSHARMEQRRRFLRVLQLSHKHFFAILKGVHFHLHGWPIEPILDRLDHGANLPLDLLQFRLSRCQA